MTSRRTVLFGMGIILAIGGAQAGFASTITYTDSAAFIADLPGAAVTLDFEAFAAGTLAASGSSVMDVTFNYDIAGLDMVVTDIFDTTSGENYLGLDDPGNFDQFVAGDEFDLTFANPILALGMFFITGDPLFAGDIRVETSVGDALNSEFEEALLGDGGLAYFVGLISTTPFSAASIRFDDAALEAFLYNVDDITWVQAPLPEVIPEPATALLLAAGSAGLALRQVRRRLR